jgi:quercetin dioxygenase-like cupin family protein
MVLRDRLVAMLATLSLAGTGTAQVAEIRPPTQSLSWDSDGCAGETFAVVSGCPSHQNAPFVIRLRMAKSLMIPSHTHPIDENITVLRGELTLRLMEGATTILVRLRQGDFFRIPAYIPHSAQAVQETEIQTYGIGPLVTTWTKERCKPAAHAAPVQMKCGVLIGSTSMRRGAG